MSILDELRREKENLRIECNAQEERLEEYWVYVNENIGGILFTSTINTVWRKLGFQKEKQDVTHYSEDEDQLASKGVLNILWSNLSALTPYAWEIAQPMIMGYAIKKVKSIFSRKKDKE